MGGEGKDSPPPLLLEDEDEEEEEEEEEEKEKGALGAAPLPAFSRPLGSAIKLALFFGSLSPRPPRAMVTRPSPLVMRAALSR